MHTKVRQSSCCRHAPRPGFAESHRTQTFAIGFCNNGRHTMPMRTPAAFSVGRNSARRRGLATPSGHQCSRKLLSTQPEPTRLVRSNSSSFSSRALTAGKVSPTLTIASSTFCAPVETKYKNAMARPTAQGAKGSADRAPTAPRPRARDRHPARPETRTGSSVHSREGSGATPHCAVGMI